MTPHKRKLTVAQAGRKGGFASAKKMTPEQRSARAKKASDAARVKRSELSANK
ncbi:MAG TPA: hypothetical protein VGG11_13730 [Xanthobacteraceae bacterium]|jgi:hypothetical protein